MIVILVLLFISHGARGIFMKLGQKGRVSTLKQALVYTTVYSALQAAVLLASRIVAMSFCEPRSCV